MVLLWGRELEDHVHSFVEQAVLVSKWDEIMLGNFKKIVQLQNQVRNVQLAQAQLNGLLGTIKAHQSEFHSLLDNLEGAVESLPKRAQISAEELRREEAFILAESIDRDLLNMSDALSSTVSQLNTSTERQLSPDNPLSAILKILNVHQNSLNWLEDSAGELQNSLQSVQRNVSQITVAGSGYDAQAQQQMRQIRQGGGGGNGMYDTNQQWRGQY